MNQTTPRKPSDTTDSNQSTTSSPISGISSLHSMAGDRSGQRFMPRTSSIDSAISSLSSASQSHRSTFDANSVSQADIGNLISTAGSAEAVIIHLLKEKHHAASQNSQLWRLVDKQRTLILGLNKDLERALKEKEKYKTKAKELQTPLPVNSKNYTIQPRGTEGDAVVSQDQDRQTQNQPGPSRNTGDYNQENLNSQNDVSTTNDSPVESHGKGDQGRESQKSQAPLYSRDEHSATSPNSFASSNDSSLSEKPIQEKIPHPMRKPPPAPLKLGKMGGTIIEHPESDSESEYEDIDAVDEMDRGRRKTRDDDDREREAAHAKEDAQYSKPAHPSGAQPMPVGLPSSPRPIATQSPPPIERSGSLASILSPRTAHTGSLKERSFLSSAPKSPGLPVSPRPEDRPIGAPLPRMPRELPNGLTPVSIPPTNSNLSGLALSPRTTRNPNTFTAPGNSLPSGNPANIGPPIPLIDATVKIDSPRSPDPSANGIYQGLVSDEYPDLLLSPNALPLIEVKVASSRLRPSRNSYMAPRPSEEEPVFTLSIFSRSDSMELWRVEKVIAALPQLDQQVRQLCFFAGKLPDRSIFTGHSPAKIDARRAALTSYFATLLDTPMDEKAALVICRFLTSDAIEARDDETSLLKSSNQMKAEILRGPDGKPRKEGYLTKRGKNFGGWKARYFVLHGPELRYFEAPGGAHLGTIKIPNAQIGKQSQNTSAQSASLPDDDFDNQYRHAFLILEPKKKDSSALVRHVLCAESDEDRDAWVEALLEYVEGPAAEYESANATNTRSQPQTPTPDAGPKSAKMFPNEDKKNSKGSDGPDSDGPDIVQGFSFDDAVPAKPPVLGSNFEKPTPKSPLFPSSTWGPSADANQTTNTTLENGQLSSKIISGPTNGAVIQNAGAWGNRAANATAIKEKKRSIWGFGKTRSSMDIASQLQQADRESPTSQAQGNAFVDRKDFVRPVFGIPLAEAVQYCAPQGVDVELPAVVYRCIEYLQAKGASSEEGIFRLSGSNVVIKALKERFNTEGDIDFLAGDEYYDVHAVASLFKQYLRELPTTVLTRELHLEFLRVLGEQLILISFLGIVLTVFFFFAELDEREKKIAAFNFLVHRLPKANLTLLRALSQFLIEIVNNSAVNKMTVRNVGIVFAPTLNIPAPVFSMFLTDYDSIFDQSPELGGSAMESAVDDPKASDVLRSPRRQVFSDIPTPSYNQTTFRHDQLEDPRGAYDTGLTYAQPSHVSENYNYMPASMNQMLNPNLENARSAKANRRESSMLFMELGNQNPSIPTSRAD